MESRFKRREGNFNLRTLDSIMPREEHSKLSTIEKLKLYDEHGFIHYSSSGQPYWKKYLHLMPGEKAGNFWGDITQIKNNKQKVGYNTQKPLALMERIIQASSKPGDIILDPFCGCATTCVASERLNRQWIGIDISKAAKRLVVARIKEDQGLYQNIVAREDIPKRTDQGKIPKYNCKENKEQLYGQQKGICNICEDHFEYRHLVVDHVVPRVDGGQDNIENLQLTCSNCNSQKGRKSHAEISIKVREDRKHITTHKPK